jgi:predicted nucleic acid-binding protein
VASSFYFDSSALGKRYASETGSLLVDAILDSVPHGRTYLLNVGAAELVSILVRKRNAGRISGAYFRQAYADFESEILHSADIRVQRITRRLVISSLPLIVTHSINSTDALTLKSALAIARRLRRDGDDLVLVASDQRLLHAAQAEGLITFNPEIQDHRVLAPLLR